MSPWVSFDFLKTNFMARMNIQYNIAKNIKSETQKTASNKINKRKNTIAIKAQIAMEARKPPTPSPTFISGKSISGTCPEPGIKSPVW